MAFTVNEWIVVILIPTAITLVVVLSVCCYLFCNKDSDEYEETFTETPWFTAVMVIAGVVGIVLLCVCCYVCCLDDAQSGSERGNAPPSVIVTGTTPTPVTSQYTTVPTNQNPYRETTYTRASPYSSSSDIRHAPRASPRNSSSDLRHHRASPRHSNPDLARYPHRDSRYSLRGSRAELGAQQLGRPSPRGSPRHSLQDLGRPSSRGPSDRTPSGRSTPRRDPGQDAPPAYDDFAPPSYDLVMSEINRISTS